MANVYGMTAGAGADPYTGSYNITPTTSDITLNTTDKILEGNLTIQGGENLYGSAIKYGSSIFGVNGTGVPLTFRGGQGMAFKNGVAYDGDIIRNVEDGQKKLTNIGEMRNNVNKYGYYDTNYPYLVFRNSQNTNIYALWDTGSTLTFYDYSKLETVVEYNFVELLGATIGTTNFSVSITQNCLFAQIITVTNTQYIYKFDSNGQLNKRVLIGSDSAGGTPLYITNEHIACCVTDDTTRKIKIIIFDMQLNIVSNNSADPQDLNMLGLLGNYSVTYGDDGKIYLYLPEIFSNTITIYASTIHVYTTTGSIIYRKNVYAEDLSFLPSGTSTAYSTLYVYINYLSTIWWYYSNSDSRSNNGDRMYVASFNSTMTIKNSDKQFSPQFGALMNKISRSYNDLAPSFYFDEDTNTISYWTANGAMRVDLNGTVYSYCIVLDNLESSFSPCQLENGEIDYLHLLETVYEDTSVIKQKTITTDTYTATIEEV